MNPRSSTVSPEYWHFLDAEPKLARQEQNLRIEAPTLDSLQRKNRLCRSASERFETALRIFESPPQNNPQQQIEDSSKKLPMQ